MFTSSFSTTASLVWVSALVPSLFVSFRSLEAVFLLQMPCFFLYSALCFFLCSSGLMVKWVFRFNWTAVSRNTQALFHKQRWRTKELSEVGLYNLWSSLSFLIVDLFSFEMVRSRLQKQVLSLYRAFLRASEDKPGFKDHIRYEFRKNSVIPKTDGLRIEYLLRRAQNQLKQLQKMECQSIGFFTRQDDKQG